MGRGRGGYVWGLGGRREEGDCGGEQQTMAVSGTAQQEGGSSVGYACRLPPLPPALSGVWGPGG